MNGLETEKDKLGNEQVRGHVKGAGNVIERRLEVRYCEGKKKKHEKGYQMYVYHERDWNEVRLLG